MFLLDTNVISELRRPEKANGNVVAWASTLPATSFYLSTISIFEIELGTLQISRRDQVQGSILRSWIDDQILPHFDGRILGVDTTVAQRCARLHVPDPRAERDALVAATALVHGLTVVTRNLADFELIGVPLLDPWAVPADRQP
jgi:predicted nucleic acid-binding protein